MTKATPTTAPTGPGKWKVFDNIDTPDLVVRREGMTHPASMRPCIGIYSAYRLGRFNYVVESSWIPRPWNANNMPAGLMNPSSNDFVRARNKAYSAFVDKVHGEAAAMIAVDLGESHKSFNMIASRAKQLRDAIKALKQGNFVRLRRTLMIPPEMVSVKGLVMNKKRLMYNKRRTFKESLADQWLEFHFGWRPLVEDIFNAAKALTVPLDNYRSVLGSGKVEYHEPIGMAPYVQYKGSLRLGYRANVRVTNPRLVDASRLGLLNPASIAWELAPFSFVADWAVNIGQMIGSLTDLAGVEISDTQETTKQTCEMSFLIEASRGEVKAKSSATYNLDSFQRNIVAVPAPNFAFSNVVGGKTRSLTQLALLSQAFSKISTRRII